MHKAATRNKLLEFEHMFTRSACYINKQNLNVFSQLVKLSNQARISYYAAHLAYGLEKPKILKIGSCSARVKLI